MIDANQRWDVEEAINWVTQLKEFKPLWIEDLVEVAHSLLLRSRSSQPRLA